MGSLETAVSEYCSKLLIFRLPMKSLLALVIVLIPLVALTAVIDETPIILEDVCTTFALNVLMPVAASFPFVPAAVPEFEYTDFTSDIPYCLMLVTVLLIDSDCVEIPLVITRTSLLRKFPFLSYTVKAVPTCTGLLKNPVAPLLFPLTYAGTDTEVC